MITMSHTCTYLYFHNTHTTVMLQANNSSFKGFLVQARKVGFPDNVTGIYQSSNTNDYSFQNCDQVQVSITELL